MELARIAMISNRFSLPCWKYMEISSLRMLEVIAMMGVVLSNCRTRCVADTPSRFGMMMSIRTRSYLAPELSLFTASKPSSYLVSAIWYLFQMCRFTYSTVNRTVERI